MLFISMPVDDGEQAVIELQRGEKLLKIFSFAHRRMSLNVLPASKAEIIFEVVIRYIS